MNFYQITIIYDHLHVAAVPLSDWEVSGILGLMVSFGDPQVGSSTHLSFLWTRPTGLKAVLFLHVAFSEFEVSALSSTLGPTVSAPLPHVGSSIPLDCARPTGLNTVLGLHVAASELDVSAFNSTVGLALSPPLPQVGSSIQTF